MSDKNPLLQSNNIRIRHVIIACQYTKDAESLNKKLTEMDVGEIFNGSECGGKCAIILNEFTDNSFIIGKASWDYNFNPPEPNTNSVTSNGYIEILDAVPGRFHNKIVNNILYEIEDYSIGNLVFAMYTFFTPPNYNETEDGIINPKPYVFHVTNLKDVFTNVDGRSGKVTLQVTSASYSLAQMTNISKIYQTTITNIINESVNNKDIKEFDGSGIGSRKLEDAKFDDSRQRRMNKNKTMYTLNDVFNSFISSLNQQQKAHENQLQSRLSAVKEGYITKFGNKISQNIIKNEDYVPISFQLNLDEKYKNYTVDNINIPFEQSHVKRNLKGIKSLSIPSGMTISEAVHHIMKLSSQVGKDVEDEPALYYKVILTTEKTCDGSNLITIKIRNVIMPNNVNDKNVDTGEIEDNEDKLIFEVNNPIPNSASSVITFSATSYANITETPAERLNDDIDIVTYGDIEQPTHFRNAQVKFNESLYNGFRVVSPTITKNYGLSDMISAESFDNNSLSQDSPATLVVRGNPYLFSDLNRTPSDVSDDIDDTSQLYTFSEYQPIYIKVRVYQPLVSQLNDDDDPLFYYTGNYHVARVVNVFNAGGFAQKLELYRNGDFI